jgi:hypothetical protein
VNDQADHPESQNPSIEVVKCQNALDQTPPKLRGLEYQVPVEEKPVLLSNTVA